MTAAGVSGESFDYVVVGSGAGGGPLAARLARAGKRVLLLEAGGTSEGPHYQVPCFHALATEDPALCWDYFVHHYSDLEREKRDSKYVADRDGVLYPRAGTLGGCTAHNAMITVYPHNADWDGIAQATGDGTWASDAMRRYFERLEHCDYLPRPRAYPRQKLLADVVRRLPVVERLFGNTARHGFDGWLHTSLPDLRLVLKDGHLLETVVEAAGRVLSEDLGRPLTLFETLTRFRDPNDWRVQVSDSQGLWLDPLATIKGVRNGTREFINATAAAYPDRLVVRTGALVTRVLLDEARRATGVEYLEGAHLYRADPSAAATGTQPQARQVQASQEVILSAGAFNTPQLLMLSGIGPAAELQAHGIEVKVELPGVGENLQDRYEVGVVTQMSEDFSLLRDCTWQAPSDGQPPDDCYRAWLDHKGVYTTNGVTLAVIRRSGQTELPDLFIFGLPSYFRGYFPGYSHLITDVHNKFNWAILKAHTNNTAGNVRLRSADPRDTPVIDFNYFDEGNDAAGADLEAVVDGVKFARRIMGAMPSGPEQEVLPGKDVATDDQLREWVKDNAWGHHASCTCKIGAADDPMAVLDSEFRVRGTQALRVVDASVFPRIPGFFIVSAIYMVSEKAADTILRGEGSQDGKIPSGVADLRSRAATLARRAVQRTR